ncbi:hypothetical protein GDO86_014302 [Hymenochirus boettgeri]|uniref:Uncharacterized protein n=1 Tax=Hymenochirus boettgeri TaxID=247094 RepID=A0A8T2JWR7_9PIPI|nr:hypothetical protein GDO86_014302 [Hymenochirus boettgeri]
MLGRKLIKGPTCLLMNHDIQDTEEQRSEFQSHRMIFKA